MTIHVPLHPKTREFIAGCNTAQSSAALRARRYVAVLPLRCSTPRRNLLLHVLVVFVVQTLLLIVCVPETTLANPEPRATPNRIADPNWLAASTCGSCLIASGEWRGLHDVFDRNSNLKSIASIPPPDTTAPAASIPVPPLIRVLIIPGFRYERADSWPDDPSESTHHFEILGSLPVDESEAASFRDSIHAWKHLESSTRLELWSGQTRALPEDSSHRAFLWRTRHAPYGLARINSTEYRVHTYSVSDRDNDSTIYYVQIGMFPVVHARVDP